MPRVASSFDALMKITSRPEIVFVRGAGSYLWDQDGKKYLDFVQGWAVNCLGHAPPVLAEALATQAALLVTPSPAFYNEPSLRLANELVQKSHFDQVFFANSGSEANEGAIKLARKYGAKHKGGAYEVITFERSFHGRTLATMTASGKKSFERLFEPKVPGFPKAKLNDLESVRELISSATIAVMIEPIQGEAGVWPASEQFLRDLRALTREERILLIVDEIQTGMGRTGTLFGYQHSGIAPDIMTLGKGMGGGVPLAALLATDEVSCFEYGDQGGTFNGNPLMCAAGLAVINQVGRSDFLKSIAEHGLHLELELRRLAERHGLGKVRGRGLLLALDLKSPVGQTVVARAFANGLLINSPQPDTLRFMPALNVTRAEIAEMIEGLDTVLSQVISPLNS